MQTGLMKNKYIADNTLLLTNIIEECQRRNLEAILINIDFEKAFDTVEWYAVMKVLDRFGFGPFFTNAIRILYNEPFSAVLNNGYWSEWFQSSTSCCQGDPTSPLIFNVVVEVLGSRIHSNPNIRGIVINGEEHKGAQYADDFWLTLIAAPENINEALVEF